MSSDTETIKIHIAKWLATDMASRWTQVARKRFAGVEFGNLLAFAPSFVKWQTAVFLVCGIRDCRSWVRSDRYWITAALAQR